MIYFVERHTDSGWKRIAPTSRSSWQFTNLAEAKRAAAVEGGAVRVKDIHGTVVWSSVLDPHPLEGATMPHAYPINAQKIDDPAIAAECKKYGSKRARVVDHDDRGNVLYAILDGRGEQMVLHTNGNPVWEDDPDFLPALEDLGLQRRGRRGGATMHGLEAGKRPHTHGVVRKGWSPTVDNTDLEVWEERDRLHIGLTRKSDGGTVIDLWDDAAREAIEDGFVVAGKGKAKMHKSLVEYCISIGIGGKGGLEGAHRGQTLIIAGRRHDLDSYQPMGPFQASEADYGMYWSIERDGKRLPYSKAIAELRERQLTVDSMDGLEGLDLLRIVRFAPYRKGAGPTFTLTLWDTGRQSHGKDKLAYRLTASEKGKSTVIFEGDDFGASPMHAIDSNETVRSLMTFLTLRKGDTDAEYFKDYTPAQLRFSEQHAEALGYEVDNRFGEDR